MIFRHIVTLGRANGLAEDAVVNTWHTVGDAIPAAEAQLEDVQFAFAAFYQDLASWLSSVISDDIDAHTVKTYVVQPGAGPQGQDLIGSPVRIHPFQTVPVSGQPPMPAEVAVCLSLNAPVTNVPEELGATRPAARRRGRVYFGPLPTNAISNAISDARPLAALRTALLTATETLVASLAATTSHQVAVYSRTDLAARSVVRAGVDDSFDTIRSRGIKKTLTDRVDLT